MSREIVPAQPAEPAQTALAKLEGKLLAAYAPRPSFDRRDGWTIGFTVSDFEFERDRPRDRWHQGWAHQLANYQHKAREWMAYAPSLAELKQRQALLEAGYKGASDRNVSRALIGLLLDSFPAGRPADFDRYADAILHDVVELGFSPQILARACQIVRRTSEFLPTVARVITACEEAKKELRAHLQTANIHVRKAEGAAAALALPQPELA